MVYGRVYGDDKKWEHFVLIMPHYDLTDSSLAFDGLIPYSGFELAGMASVDGIFTLIFKRPYTDGKPFITG